MKSPSLSTLLAGALVAWAAGSLSADDALRPVTVRHPPATKLQARAPAEREAEPVDRELEIRVGPRATFLTGDVRVGKTGSAFDVWNDLKLDDVNLGVQFDVDWQPVKNLHLAVGMTWDKYDQNGVTQKDISDGENILRSGATTRVDLDIYTFKAVIGYDVIKNRTYRLRPYVGGKVGVVDGTASWTGIVANSAGANLDTRTKSTSLNAEAYGTWLVGIDQRIYVSRDWCLGADLGASTMDHWYLLSGNAYTGYDFSKNWGIRLGYACEYVSWENGPKSGKADPLLGAAYVQAVWGF